MRKVIKNGDFISLAKRYKRLLLLKSGISHVRGRYDRRRRKNYYSFRIR
jgi:hypothetical protein